MKCYVQRVIRIYVLRIIHFGHHGAKFYDILETDTARSKPACQTEQMSADVINLRRLSHTHFPHEHTAIRDQPDQIAFFQTATGFPYRSSANTEHLGQCALVNAISRLQFSSDDHPL